MYGAYLISPTGLSPSMVWPSSQLRLSNRFVTPPGVCNHLTIASLYPQSTTLAGFFMLTGLGSSPFARRYSGNHFVFFSSRYLDVSVPWVRLPTRRDDSALPEPGCPIRISTDLRSCAPPRGFSQLTTSFFASSCLGIHRMPLAT